MIYFKNIQISIIYLTYWMVLASVYLRFTHDRCYAWFLKILQTFKASRIKTERPFYYSDMYLKLDGVIFAMTLSGWLALGILQQQAAGNFISDEYFYKSVFKPPPTFAFRHFIRRRQLVKRRDQGDQKVWVKSRPMSVKSCPKILSQVKWNILALYQKWPKNVGDLG